MLSIQNSHNFTLGYLDINSTTSHTVDVQGSNNISIFNSSIQSSAGALEINGSSGIHILNNKIFHSANAISIYNSNNTEIKYNLVYGNKQSGMEINNLQNSLILYNTFVNNAYQTTTTDTIHLWGQTNINTQFSNNIVSGSAGGGVGSELDQSFTGFSANDVFGNNPNYRNFPDKTGLNGNISEDPLLNSNQNIYCPAAGSPVIYGDLTKYEYMGYISSCGNNPTPTPSPFPTPTPAPTCIPRPACLDANPACLPPEPVGGWCPTPTPSVTPSPSATPSPTESPTLTPSPAPIPGDVNGDGVVNIIDIGIIIDNYRTSPPGDVRADLNHDGVVNIVDIGIIIDHYQF
jgi:hypothetical protein